VAKKKEIPGKRPYALGRRQHLSDRKRLTILKAARKQLKSAGFLRLTMDSLASETGITRQTIHNLFRTKAGLLEALFDHLALDAGVQRMREVMQQSDPDAMVAGFVKIFCDFWTRDRILIRRIHGIAAIDPEFGVAVEARNRRRQGAAARVVDRLAEGSREKDGIGRNEYVRDGERDRSRAQKVAALYALTSFEFFDALAESCGDLEETVRLVFSLAAEALAPRS
jgi:AcrR family transcriptional regulator